MIQKFKFKDHEEWLSIRAKYIGGSDAGAVIGMNPYKSAYSLWAEKTGKIPGFEGNVITKVGSYLEEFVAKMFEEETGKKVRRNNHTLVNDLYPFACANVDREIVGEDAILEIKTTNNSLVMKQLRGTEFPEAYYAQVVHYMAVTGCAKAYLAVLINCREFKVYELNRDQAEIDALMGAEKDFWHLVETDTPPAVDGSDATADALVTLYPNSNDNEVDLFAFKNNLDEYNAITKQIKTLTEIKDGIANLIKEYMRDAGKGSVGCYSVSYKTQSRKTFDTKRFEADHKDISLADYYKESSSRVFKVTVKGE